MPGFDNGVMFADNVDFTGGSPVTGKVTADGQLLIGSTASPHVKVSTITAGPGITVTNGSGAITIGAVSPVSFTWQTITSADNVKQIAVFNGYVSAGGVLCTLLLPAAANEGDMFMITGFTALFQIGQNAGQTIYLGSQTSTTGATGTVTSTMVLDHLTILCVSPNTEFKVIDSIGNFTVA